MSFVKESISAPSDFKQRYIAAYFLLDAPRDFACLELPVGDQKNNVKKATLFISTHVCWFIPYKFWGGESITIIIIVQSLTQNTHDWTELKARLTAH